MSEQNRPAFRVGRKEMERYRYLSDQIEDKSLKMRAEGSLEYFINKAVWYKKLWQWLSFLTVLLPATATFLAACEFQGFTYVMAAITAATTIVSSLLALSKCTDKKTSYRNSAEALKRELSLYLSASDVYRDSAVDQTEKDHLLAERMERLITNSYTKISDLEKGGTQKK